MPKPVFLVLLLISSVFQAQEKNDRIEQLIRKYANTLHSQSDSALYYISEATRQSKEINNTFLLSRCYYNLGNFHYLKSDLPLSKQYTDLAIVHAQKAHNPRILTLGSNQLGLIDMDRNNYNASFKNFIKALEMAQKNKLGQSECLILNNLGLLFELQKDTLRALEYYHKNEQVALREGFRDVLLMTYNNIATLKKKSNKKLAISYLNKAYHLAVDLKDDHETFNILINLSAVYLAVGSRDKVDQAYRFLARAENLALKMKSNEHLFFVYFNIGGYYYNLKNFKAAINSYKKALAFSPKGIGEDQYMNLYDAMSLTYKKAGKFEEAYHWQKKYFSVKDSIFSLEKNKAFNEIQTKYEVEKKNLHITLLTKERQLEQKRKKLYLYGGIVLLLALFVSVLFLKHRIRTQKIIRSKEAKIYQQEKQQQQQEQELKRILGVTQGQDKERNRIAKEIHDGIGGKLAGLKLHLEQVNTNLKNTQIQQIVTQLSSVFQELRKISHNLSVNNIENTKLSVLVQKLLLEYQGRKEFDVEMAIFPEHSLDTFGFDIKHQLYRILQELLVNVSRHANASRVSLSFTRYEDSLNIIVHDDGRGFSKTANPGIGLQNIRERLSTISGTMVVESGANEGTTIIIDIPI